MNKITKRAIMLIVSITIGLAAPSLANAEIDKIRISALGRETGKSNLGEENHNLIIENIIKRKVFTLHVLLSAYYNPGLNNGIFFILQSKTKVAISKNLCPIKGQECLSKIQKLKEKIKSIANEYNAIVNNNIIIFTENTSEAQIIFTAPPSDKFLLPFTKMKFLEEDEVVVFKSANIYIDIDNVNYLQKSVLFFLEFLNLNTIFDDGEKVEALKNCMTFIKSYKEDLKKSFCPLEEKVIQFKYENLKNGLTFEEFSNVFEKKAHFYFSDIVNKDF